VGLDAKALAAVEGGFTSLARGDAIVPPPMGIEVEERSAEIHIKSAYVRGLPGFAIKVASGFYANAALGLPASSGMMILLSAETGWPVAVLLDNGYLTEVRTALAGAVAAKHLAPATVKTVGVLGTGSQARYQVLALRLVRQFERVLVWGRRPEAVSRFCAEMSERLAVEVQAAPSVADVVDRSSLVVTTTAAREPLVKAVHLHEGLHITAMGSDGPGKQELEAAVLARADLLVCDRKAQCARLGELQHALAAGLLDDGSPISEIGELTSGVARGRSNDRQITVCDLTGVGVQDTAIACLAYLEARQERLGTELRA
jgi:ornithine cyclodeaminase